MTKNENLYQLPLDIYLKIKEYNSYIVEETEKIEVSQIETYANIARQFHFNLDNMRFNAETHAKWEGLIQVLRNLSNPSEYMNSLEAIALNTDKLDSWNTKRHNPGTECRVCAKNERQFQLYDLFNTVLGTSIKICYSCHLHLNKSKLKSLNCGMCNLPDSKNITLRVIKQNGLTIRDTLICENCTKREYSYCNSCDNWTCDYLIPILTEELNAIGYTRSSGVQCLGCDRIDRSRIKSYIPVAIHNYTYTPNFKFYIHEKDEVTEENKIPIHLGVELEVAFGYDHIHSRQAIAYKLITNHKEIYCKEDSSIGNYESEFVSNGVEIVTHPCSINYHAELWERVLDNLNELNGSNSRTLQSNTCGLHVSFNRETLERIQIAKLIMFLNNKDNTEFITSIAGRSSNEYAKLEHKHYSDVYDPSTETLKYNNRREGVNLTSNHRVEIRIFKATEDYYILMGRLEFVHCLVNYCRVKAKRTVWTDKQRFLDYCSDKSETYPKLTDLLQRASISQL